MSEARAHLRLVEAHLDPPTAAVGERSGSSMAHLDDFLYAVTPESSH